MFNIRPVSPDDATVVACMVESLLAELSGTVSPVRPDALLLEQTFTLISSQEIYGFLAEDGHEAIALITLNACASIYAFRFGEITEFYVKPTYRSSGIGKRLLSYAIRYAHKRNWSRLEVGTPELPSWEGTRRFYLSNGFLEIGSRMKLLVNAEHGA